MATNIKRLSKILVSSLFLLISFPLLYVSKTLFRNTSNTMILYYHTVQNEFKENFIWQIEALNKFGRILKLDTESKLNDATRKYIITFDDGFISVFNNALPEMLKRNIRKRINMEKLFIVVFRELLGHSQRIYIEN